MQHLNANRVRNLKMGVKCRLCSTKRDLNTADIIEKTRGVVQINDNISRIIFDDELRFVEKNNTSAVLQIHLTARRQS